MSTRPRTITERLLTERWLSFGQGFLSAVFLWCVVQAVTR